MSREPLVSVAVPTYNGGRWIGAAVESVLAQTYERFELVVSDGGSTDDTAEVVRSYGDPRIRIDVAARRLPAIANWNRSVILANGEYVKFLHQDDTIIPTCLEEMLAVASEDPAVGLVFACRRIELGEHHGQVDVEWSQTYADVHEGFDGLERINDGRALFRQLLDAKFETNWVGEPTSVLISRTCLATVGLFNPHLKQIMDLELWCRAMLGYRIGFVDQVLSTYLHHGDSLTDENARLARGWLDRLWLFESLLSCDLDPPDAEKIARLRRTEAREALSAQAKRIVRRRFSGELVDYAGYRLSAAVGRAPGIHPALSETELRPSG
jgi:glycosyltransferase involved in cell wall biosynthesis